ncbi:MAG: hypothetical protein QXT77_00935 [Candidatus Methanomethylicaceae archaeon]
MKSVFEIRLENLVRHHLDLVSELVRNPVGGEAEKKWESWGESIYRFASRYEEGDYYVPYPPRGNIGIVRVLWTLDTWGRKRKTMHFYPPMSIEDED